MTTGAKTVLWRSAKVVLALTVAISIAVTISKHRSELSAQLGQLHFEPQPLGAALIVAVIYRLLNASAWGLSLRALRVSLPVLPGVRLWLVSETMRWLPGSVWSYVSRVCAARQAGIDPLRASLSLSLELLLTIAAWTLTAAGGFWLSGSTSRMWGFVGSPTWPLILGLAGAALGGALGAWIFVRSNLLARLPQKVQGLVNDMRALLQTPPRADHCAAALVFYVALCVLNGINFWLVLRALNPLPVPLAAIVGINAIGWLLGFFAFLAPGGLGVREASIAGLLATLYPLPIAMGGAVVWRVLQIVSELLCLLLCLVPAVPSTTPVATGETA